MPIARWMEATLRAGKPPQPVAYSSSAARLCRAAHEAGIDLSGAQLVVSGEPVTETISEAIQSTGAELVSSYGSMEAGLIAMSCGRPERVDDLHFTSDLHALIQPGAGGRERGLPATALMLTSLRPTAPFILLNTSMGDQAEVTLRPCGCRLEALGWPAHLHTIRSFEKLTAGGMTFLDTELIRVLEALLPARFGGGPTDYQLVEEEYAGKEARLCLRVHPAVGPLDEREVMDAFLEMIGRESGAKRIVALQWREAGVLRVERQPPLATASGKILHLHLGRPAAKLHIEGTSPAEAGCLPTTTAS